MSFELWPVTLATGAVLVALAAYRLKVGAQPLRLELAEKGEQLLASGHLPLKTKAYVESLLDSAFSDRGALLFLLVAVPVNSVAGIFRDDFWGASGEPPIRDAETRELFLDVNGLHFRIQLANHPVLMLLLLVDVLVFTLPAILIRTLIRGVMPRSRAHDVVLGSAGFAHQMTTRWKEHHKAA